jgi:hypothetical protein
MSHIWVIEAKLMGADGKWSLALGFPDVPGVYLTRASARKAASQMFQINTYNHMTFLGKKLPPTVYYRAKKYKREE